MNRKYFYIIVLCLVAACSSGPGEAKTGRRSLKDMVGRVKQIPEKISKIYCISPMGTTLVYTFDPELVLGWNYPLQHAEALCMPERYKALPLIGGWFGKTASVNIELLLKARPDLIIAITERGSSKDRDLAQRLELQTGIPVVMGLGSGLQDIPALYAFLGRVTGNTSRADFLKFYAEKLLDRAASIVRKVPLAKRPRVYYAEGMQGLHTEPGDSMHVDLIRFCGGINVARISAQNNNGYGHTAVTLEQIICWEPDVVLISDFLGDEGGRRGWQKIMSSQRGWQYVKAVREKQVYVIPHTPFHWTDRPPSVNRLAGLIWLPKLFYPEACHYDLRQEVREFYKIFYGYRLADRELERLLSANLFRKGNAI